MTSIVRACWLALLSALAMAVVGLVAGLVVTYWHDVLDVGVALLCLFVIVCLTLWSD
jgi:1,4-dihydroxy-2-naphthoate octaprenyltransferase